MPSSRLAALAVLILQYAHTMKTGKLNADLHAVAYIALAQMDQGGPT